MRKSGISLVESVVSVGLSGIFIIMLSTMLAQTLQLMRANQDELTAISAAELLLENAKTTTYSDLKALASSGTPFILQINKETTSSPLRIHPVQLNLEDVNKIYGAIDGNSGTLNQAKKWSISSGNYFDAEASETVSDSTAETTNLDSVKVTVTIRYKPTGSGGGDPFSRKLVRTAYIFSEGARFQ